MFILIYIGVCLGIVGFILWGIVWSTHLSMMYEESCPTGWASFKTFKEQFKAYPDWQREKYWKNSFFGSGDGYFDYYIHADIIKFEGKGMKLYPFSYLRFKIWERKNRLKKEKEKVNWKGEN